MLFYAKYRGLIVTVPGKPDVKFKNHKFVTEDPELIEFLKKTRDVYSPEKGPAPVVVPDVTPGPVRSFNRVRKAKE